MSTLRSAASGGTGTRSYRRASTPEDRSGLRLPSSSPAPNIHNYRLSDPRARGLVLDSRVGELKLTYAVSEKGSIALSGHLANTERGGEFAPWAQLVYGYDTNGVLNQTRIALYQASLALDGKWAVLPTLDLILTSQFFNGGPTGRDQIDVNNNLFYVRRNFGYIGSESVLEARWRIIEKLAAVIGTNFIFDEEHVQTLERIAKIAEGPIMPGQIVSTAGPADPRKDLITYAAYVQMTWNPLDRYLNLIGGLRYDLHNIYGSQFSGRLGAVSSPLENLHFKLLYGGAFKAPSPLLLFATPLGVGDVLGNPSLKPQYVHTFEGEARYEPVRYLSLSTGVSYNLLLNAAEFTLEGLNQVARNLDSIRSLSWESRIEAHYEDWIKGFASLEVNHTDRTLGEPGYEATLLGTSNVIYPETQVHVGVSGRVPHVPLRASIDGRRIRRPHVIGEHAASSDPTLPMRLIRYNNCFVLAKIRSATEQVRAKQNDRRCWLRAVCLNSRDRCLAYASSRRASETNSVEAGRLYTLPPIVLLGAGLSTSGIKIFGEHETVFSLVGSNLIGSVGPEPGFNGVDYPLPPRTFYLLVRQDL